MMSAIAVLTYNREEALTTFLEGALKLNYPVAVFEDCGQKDSTRSLKWAGKVHERIERPDLMAVQYVITNRLSVFLGETNLGVSGNSNRALKWFNDGGYDHLTLCNDDLIVHGNFVDQYAKAHSSTGVGLFCFCDFTSDQFKCKPISYRGVQLKVLNRMTGIMMSLTRKVVDDIGYFDPTFFFGEDHVDYTVRARFSNHISTGGQMHYCLDINPKVSLISHSEIESSVADEKPFHDVRARSVMLEKSAAYQFTDPYMPYGLVRSQTSDGYRGLGTLTSMMGGYTHLSRP